MKTSEQTLTPSLAQCVAGEDVNVDEYIAVLSTTGQYLSYAWDRSDLPSDEIVRVRYVPTIAGLPLKVIGICLPFIYARRTNETIEIIDTRMSQIVRLEKDCAKEVWKQMKSNKVNL